MIKLTKYLKIVVVVTTVIVFVAGVDVYAEKNYDDSYSFEFSIGGWHSNGYERKGRYRTTTNTQNAWKVKLEKSQEGNCYIVSGVWDEETGIIVNN